MSLRLDDESIIVFTPTPEFEYSRRIGENQCLNLETDVLRRSSQQLVHHLRHESLEVAPPL